MTIIPGADEFDFNADVFDSRDVIDRIAYLETCDYADLTDEEKQELDDLREFADDAQSVPDWQYGETFIADHYFENYARELATDIGAINEDAGWPNSYIDWEAAADALRIDYTGFELRGNTYWAR